MLNRRKRILTVDQFFEEVTGRNERYELVDGEIWMMPGGTRRHAATAGQLLISLSEKLRGTGCEPFNSDMGLQLNLTNVRYPDVAIYCDPRDTGPEAADQQVLHFPKVIFEVLSPSTAAFDRGGKIAEYKEIPSVLAIVLVDPVRRTIELHERTGPGSWRQTLLADGAPLVLHDPVVTLTAAEIFG